MSTSTPLLGGSTFTRDVTSLFVEAAAEMEPGSLIFAQGYTLNDAMSALEIGEPRLDSGLLVDPEREQKFPFNPLTPLLPEELCWIIDRSFSYEMLWHEGNVMQHTIHTLLYVHCLGNIDPDIVPPRTVDPQRPLELITVVLRAAVAGLLKCCDLSWRELSQGSLQDLEDWQSEKCEVSLLEGLQPYVILNTLNDALFWLSTTTKVAEPHKQALISRLSLRKSLLQLLLSNVFRNSQQIAELISEASKHLTQIRETPSLEPKDPDSIAKRAFDPYISRNLNTFVPLSVIEVPPIKKTWDAIQEYLIGLHELTLLAKTKEVTTWAIVGDLRLWLPKSPLQIAYLRSATGSAFFDGILVLDTFQRSWITERFFFETCGIGFNEICSLVRRHWAGTTPTSVTNWLRELDSKIYGTVARHIQSLWFNPPRRRRHFMRSLLDWHDIYDLVVRLLDECDLSTLPSTSILPKLPSTILHWRLSVLREVVLSGFQLELYSPNERPFAYWYLTQIIETHLDSLDTLLSVVVPETPAYDELTFQHTFLTALQTISKGLFLITYPHFSFLWHRSRENFYRRYKWAFMPGYEEIETEPVGHPQVHLFMRVAMEIGDAGVGVVDPGGCFSLAVIVLESISASGADGEEKCGGWGRGWGQERLRFIRHLKMIVGNLSSLPSSMEGVLDHEQFNVMKLLWNPNVHPWFPVLK